MTFALRYWKLPVVAIACIILHNMCESNDDDFTELESEQDWEAYADCLAENSFPCANPQAPFDVNESQSQATQAQGATHTREELTENLQELRAANEVWVQEHGESQDEGMEDMDGMEEV